MVGWLFCSVLFILPLRDVILQERVHDSGRLRLWLLLRVCHCLLLVICFVIVRYHERILRRRDIGHDRIGGVIEHPGVLLKQVHGLPRIVIIRKDVIHVGVGIIASIVLVDVAGVIGRAGHLVVAGLKNILVKVIGVRVGRLVIVIHVRHLVGRGHLGLLVVLVALHFGDHSIVAAGVVLGL